MEYKFRSKSLILFVEEVCDLAGLLCLHNHEEAVNVIKPPWSKKNGLAIDCLPACDEDDISILHIRDGLTWQVQQISRVEVSNRMDFD